MKKIDQILKDVVIFLDHEDKRTDFLDKIFLHPVLGLLSLALMMFIVFQAVFAWAAPFMDGIEEFFGWFGGWIGQFISQPLLNSLVVDGIIAGAGSVLVFLPQILILFFFILVFRRIWLSTACSFFT